LKLVVKYHLYVKKKTLQVVFFIVESFEEIVELSLLFDFYGEMLGEHKKKIFEDYVLNDLSLAEIAEEEGISRQGVHDLVKRCTKQLKEYEAALHLVEKFQNMKEKLTKASVLLGTANKEADASDIAEARKLLKEMLEEL
jgi:predicted DNA-binding protein YlxM (UPF0122 family)